MTKPRKAAKPPADIEHEPVPADLLDAMRPAADVLPGLVAKARKGRPPSATRKVLVPLRIDPDVVEAYRAKGPGWQTRMHEVLRRGAKRLAPSRKRA